MGELPYKVIYNISKWIAYNCFIGKSDIGGEDLGDFFAKAIEGEHLASPVGLADVVLEGQAWSVKTVKNSKPHTCKKIRIISGRNSPNYSYKIQNPLDDLQMTGEAVLNIWNERVKIALDKYDSLRTIFFIREINRLEFTLFELETHRFPSNEYIWKANENNNLEGFDRTTGTHRFTWQPHGSQFTINYVVPASSTRFTVKRPPVIDIMEQIGFDETWITIIK